MTDPAGQLVFDMRGLVSHLDRWGDTFLRIFDEKFPPQRLSPLRYRGTPQEIADHCAQLGLASLYGLHPWGIVVKSPDVLWHGVALQDIWQANSPERKHLGKVDRFAALAMAVEYVNNLHATGGAIGELLPSDIIFQSTNESSVGKPVLNICDIIFNKGYPVSQVEQQATDLLDFFFSIGFAEWGRSGDWQMMEKALQIVTGSYRNKPVLSKVHEFAKEGRLVIPGDEKMLGQRVILTLLVKPWCALHNQVRLGYQQGVVGQLRQMIIASTN